MLDLNFFKEAPLLVNNFLNNLKRDNSNSFQPALRGTTQYGDQLSLGFSCFVLKILYMNNEWLGLSHEKKIEWIDYINSFQVENSDFQRNSFVDATIVKAYLTKNFEKDLKFFAKKILNQTLNKKYDLKVDLLNKAINAETKQAVSTLSQLGFQNNRKINQVYTNNLELTKYLENLDWTKPWSAGAQYSSICVFSVTQNLDLQTKLENFIDSLANKETGSYYTKQPKSQREVINGAMKVISGLDWLEKEIHYPKELVDFCLHNNPILEGCDIVDFVYVLYSCSQQTDYKKSQIQKLFKEILNDIRKLYHPKDEGFSYFFNKSQTHYYGVEITKGEANADLHSTLLCIWAIIMILDILEEKPSIFNVIKP